MTRENLTPIQNATILQFKARALFAPHLLLLLRLIFVENQTPNLNTFSLRAIRAGRVNERTVWHTPSSLAISDGIVTFNG